MPRISVIIPVYNAQNTILETVNSVLSQTFPNFELIIINDGSTDNTLNLLSSIDDQRIKVFSYENGGLSTARNRGIELAQGEYIAFLDADDLWTFDKLELQLKALQESARAGVAYSWTYFMDEQGESYHTIKPILFEGNVLSQLLKWNFIACGSNPLIRKKAIDSIGFFDNEIAGAADWDYWIRLAIHWSYVLVPKEQVFYRQSSGSMSSKIEYMEECQLKVLENAFEVIPSNIGELKNECLSNVYQYSSKLYLDRSSGYEGFKKATLKILKSISLHPKNILRSNTQSILVKLLLIMLFSPSLANSFLVQVSRMRSKEIRSQNTP